MFYLKEIKKEIKKLLFSKDKNYKIGNFIIKTPYYHTLPINQSLYLNYDKPLINIILNIDKLTKKKTIIDIGANIGDTAILLKNFSDSIIYCIEGNKQYLKYLQQNIFNVKDIIVIDSYVAGRASKNSYVVKNVGGTASLKESNEISDSIINISPLVKLIDNKIFEDVKIIKIDTDGFDFDILLANKNIITTFKPNIYFEYDISFNKNDHYNSIELIEFLVAEKYMFILYDNFGNLFDFIYDGVESAFNKLNMYLTFTNKFNGGIYYFDIFASTDYNLLLSVFNDEIHKNQAHESTF